MDQPDKSGIPSNSTISVTNSSVVEDGPPPPYSAVESSTTAAGPAPAYTDQMPNGPLPTRPIPAVLNAYSSWSQFKSFKLCGATEEDVLFVVEQHTGYSRKPPLGTRPGMLLHSGTSKEGPIVAAAGDMSQLAARAYAFEPESIILMPSLPTTPAHSQTQGDGLVTERMHAQTRGGDVVFSFSIEVGQVGEKLRREEFVWTRVNEGHHDGSVREGSFQLTRPGLRSTPTMLSTNTGGGQQKRFYFHSANESETLAVLEWSRWLFNPLFTLRFVGSGLSDTLGERWKLIVVTTAVRLLALKLKGRTTKFHVGVGEKVHRDKSGVEN